MKTYFSIEFDSIYKAMEACDKNQDWNVINIYPTGWRHEVCVVYYTTEKNKVMKANEAPERIWMDLEWIPHFDCKDCVTEDSIEYIRKDAFIEKACEWLKENCKDYVVVDIDNKYEGIDGLFIEDFRKYMDE